MADPLGGKPPVFILGVPRSGTTLLRTLLDSHPAIACGPETPWLAGHQPRSVMELWSFLREHEAGYCSSYGMDKAVATSAARALVSTLMDRYAAARGKTRWAEKTPDNVLHVPFLLELFPEARVIHLTRDGLDVALSTSVTAEHRRGISGFLERNLGFGPCAPAAENNPLTALLRWHHWERLLRVALAGREHLHVSYERLVTEPRPTLRQIMEFIGEPFEPAMLDYARFRHDYPAWEWGSADVQARGGIARERAGRARRELTPTQLAVLDPVARGDGALDPSGSAARDPAADPVLSLASSYIDGFARRLGLAPSGATWDAAWLWLHGLGRRNWDGQRLLCLGDGRCGPAWAAALLGARLTIAGPEPDPALKRLADGLRVRVEWQTTREGPPPQDEADGVIGLRLVRGRDPGLDQLARALKPGGLLAVSFDLYADGDGAAARLETDLFKALGNGTVAHLDAGGPGTRVIGAALAVRADGRPG